MRIRERKQDNTSQNSYNSIALYPYNWVTSNLTSKNGIYPAYSWYSHIEDSVGSSVLDYNPVYHRKNTAALFSGEVEHIYDPPLAPAKIKVSGGVLFWNDTPTFTPPWGALVDELSATLQGRLNDSAMLLLTVKELPQTIAMLKNPFSLLTKNWRKTAKQFSASSLAKESANVWLEHLYGWKSAYRDLSDIAKATARAVTPVCHPEFERRVLSRYSAEQTESGMIPQGSYCNFVYSGITNDSAWKSQLANPTTFGPTVRVHSKVYHNTSRVTCYCAGAALTAASKTQRLLAGFDISSSWQSYRDLLWEAIPFSFVVDWFVDLRGLWAPLNRALIASLAQGRLGYSTKQTMEYQADCYVGRWWNLYNWGGAYRNKIPNSIEPASVPSTGLGKYTVYRRTQGMPPNQDWSAMLVNKGLTLTQCASGISLIAQRAF